MKVDVLLSVRFLLLSAVQSCCVPTFKTQLLICLNPLKSKYNLYTINNVILSFSFEYKREFINCLFFTSANKSKLANGKRNILSIAFLYSPEILSSTT